MTPTDEIFNLYADSYGRKQEAQLDLKEFLDSCRTDPMMYASAAERMLHAIGEPLTVDTAADERLGRIFMNRTIKTYPTFKD